MTKKTELELAEEWTAKLNPHEKKRIYGGTDPPFDKWWPTLTTVDKLYEYNKWNKLCPGTLPKAKPKAAPAPEKKKTPPKKKGKKK